MRGTGGAGLQLRPSRTDHCNSVPSGRHAYALVSLRLGEADLGDQRRPRPRSPGRDIHALGRAGAELVMGLR